MSVPRKRKFPRTPIVRPLAVHGGWQDIGGGYVGMSFGGGGSGGVLWPSGGGGGGVVTFKWPEGERIYTGGGPR